MKFFPIFLITVAFFACADKPDSYLIIGNVDQIPDSTIIDLYVSNTEFSKLIASDTIIDGYFNFSGSLDSYPKNMSLSARDQTYFNGSCHFWAEHEKIEVSGSGRFLSAWTANGNNKELQALNRLNSKTKVLSAKKDSLYLTIVNNSDDIKTVLRCRNELDSIRKIVKDIKFKLIEEDPNSLSAVKRLYLISKFDTSYSKSRIRAIYEKMDTSYQNTLWGQGILARTFDHPSSDIGNPMIDFAARDTSGHLYHLRDFLGKYILLDFWSLACGSCRKAVPEKRDIFSKNEDVLSIIGINMFSNEDSWRKASVEDSISWINLSDGMGTFAGASLDYGIRGFPSFVLIDRQGIIIDRWMGYSPGKMKERLSKHISELKL